MIETIQKAITYNAFVANPTKEALDGATVTEIKSLIKSHESRTTDAVDDPHFEDNNKRWAEIQFLLEEKLTELVESKVAQKFSYKEEKAKQRQVYFEYIRQCREYKAKRKAEYEERIKESKERKAILLREKEERRTQRLKETEEKRKQQLATKLEKLEQQKLRLEAQALEMRVRTEILRKELK